MVLELLCIKGRNEGLGGRNLLISQSKSLAGSAEILHLERNLTFSQETLQTQPFNYFRSRLKNSFPGSQTYNIGTFQPRDKLIGILMDFSATGLTQSTHPQLVQLSRDAKGLSWVSKPFQRFFRSCLCKDDRILSTCLKFHRHYARERQCVY